MTPVWQQIRDAVSDEIAAGRYPPGARLPSEAALASRFGVNRHTVRRGLAALQDNGIVHARRGSGVFVTGTQLRYRLGRRTRFSQNLAEAGKTGSHDVLRVETLPADPEEAEALALGKGDLVHVINLVGQADGVPITYAHSVFPADRLPALPEAIRENPSITRAMEIAGHGDYRRLSTRLAAVEAPSLVARHLQIRPGAPVLRTVAINTDPDGIPLEYGKTWFAAERVELFVDDKSFG